jgi:hypothetical protein
MPTGLTFDDSHVEVGLGAPQGIMKGVKVS